MRANSLQDLYLEQLKDLYDAEHQLIKALPKMAKAAPRQNCAVLAALLERTLDEEKEADHVLGGIADKINVEISRANPSAKRMVHTSGSRSKPAA